MPTILEYISEKKEELTAQKTRKEYIEQTIEDKKEKRKRVKRLSRDLEQALIIAQDVSQMTQEQLEYQISTLVTNSLDAIFPEPYVFKVSFEIKRGKTEASMFFSKNGEELNPLTSTGGGVVDVASFALRLTSFLISKQKPPPLLIMDEPFRFVSLDYQEKVAILLEEMSKKFGIQIIIVTHEETYQVGNVIKIK